MHKDEYIVLQQEKETDNGMFCPVLLNWEFPIWMITKTSENSNLRSSPMNAVYLIIDTALYNT